jgi:uncharacterized membrane protein YdjX (TVP38/TMEM64 family)
LYKRLRESIPSIGIVLDCCMKPSHDLGRQEHFAAMFDEMRDYLLGNGVGSVIVACPNCYKVFARYGKGLVTRTLYEILAGDDAPESGPSNAAMTIHDPCATRFEAALQDSVRELARKGGCSIEEMPHSRRLTLCCGEGGAVGALAPGLAGTWTRLRRDEAAGKRMITYCAGCANTLGRVAPTTHILDVIGDPEAGRRAKVARPPLTYWKRLRLKKWFRRNVPAAVSRERTFPGKDTRKKGAFVKFSIFILFLAAVIATVRITGASRYLEQETLRASITGYGVLAPVVYILIYTVAPALFLPGLPITVAGGILFGPFWGVVYAITGATMGACLAFLVSRYLAREWVEGKLTSPRWRRLDEAVKRHGWRVVAFTRLIPIFPFNLLNYAFGLTRISFRQYALTTFIAMLPACIAFIVFSSSLLDLIRGRVSPTFIIGLLLVAAVSMIPVIYRRYKKKRGEDEPL